MNAQDRVAVGKDLGRLGAADVVSLERLAEHTTFRMGGPADLGFWPDSLDTLVQGLDFLAARGVPTLFLGAGSHVLIPDHGFRGVAVHTDALSERFVTGSTIRVEAGTTLRSLADHALHAGLSGLEFAADIPGHLGASVALNAGAYGSALAERIEAVWVLSRDEHGAGVDRLEPAECGFSRHASALRRSGRMVLAAAFRLEPEDPKEIQERMEHLSHLRQASQPQGQPTFGCMFSNPPGQHAGRLIEAAGLKGTRVGNVRISRVHANFLINLGGARYADVLRLIDLAKSRVETAHGVQLTPEVEIIPDEEPLRS